MHAVRVVAVPPSVKEPAGHVVQLAAFAALYSSSAPHAALTLVPSHEWYPAGHSEHEVRSWPLLLPPPVYEPVRHVLQVLAPTVLYMLSAPHTGLVPPPGQ